MKKGKRTNGWMMSKLVSRNNSTPPRSAYTEGERAHSHDTNSANRDTGVVDRGQVNISCDGEPCIEGQQIADHNQENVTEGHGGVGKESSNESGEMPGREAKRKRPTEEDQGEESKKRHKRNSEKGKDSMLTEKKVKKMVKRMMKKMMKKMMKEKMRKMRKRVAEKGDSEFERNTAKLEGNFAATAQLVGA